MDEVDQPALPECLGLGDPPKQGLLQLVGVGGQLKAYVEATRLPGRGAM